MPSPVRIRTLGDLADAGYWLTICCARQTPPCNHSAHVDVQWLVQRVARNYPCDAKSIQKIGWRCTQCGSRKITIRNAAGQTYQRPTDEDLPF